MRSARASASLAAIALFVALGGVSSAFAQAGAPQVQTLHVAFPVAETGFDPQATSDLYSDHVQRAIFDTLYGFDYLARPYKRVPRIAAAMPQIEDGGRSWTIRIRQGIYFAKDPAFGGKKRELTAADYVYAWKRLLDPRVRSPFSWYLQGKIVGADEVIEAARKSGRFDYDAPIEGLSAPDRYTIRLKLKEPDYILFGYMCSSPMAAVAREVIERYGDPANGWTMDHPVGTGPFMLKSWRRGQQIVLEANPDFRDERFPQATDDADRKRFAAVRGKKLPLVDDDTEALARARIAVRRDEEGLQYLINQVPAALKDDPGLAFERARYMRKRKMESVGMSLVSRFPPAIDDQDTIDRMWTERKFYFNAAIRARNWNAAYSAMAGHGFPRGEPKVEAEFFAG